MGDRELKGGTPKLIQLKPKFYFSSISLFSAFYWTPIKMQLAEIVWNNLPAFAAETLEKETLFYSTFYDNYCMRVFLTRLAQKCSDQFRRRRFSCGTTEIHSTKLSVYTCSNSLNGCVNWNKFERFSGLHNFLDILTWKFSLFLVRSFLFFFTHFFYKSWVSNVILFYLLIHFFKKNMPTKKFEHHFSLIT